MYPRLLVIGAIAGMTGLSFAARVRPAAVSLVGRAGGSALQGMRGDGTIAFTGCHAGVGAIVTADARTAYAVPTFTLGFFVRH